MSAFSVQFKVKLVVEDIRRRLVRFGMIAANDLDEEEAVEPVYSGKGDASLMLKVKLRGQIRQYNRELNILEMVNSR